MENQDNNLFDQFKKAADNSESTDFPGLEKVWSRVDAKLDTQIYQQQKNINSGWKKFAVAASIVVGTVFAYQVIKKEKTAPAFEDNTTRLETPKNNTSKSEVVITEDSNLIVEKKEAEKIIEKQIRLRTQVATSTHSANWSTNDTLILREPAKIVSNESDKTERENATMMRGEVYDAIGVKHIRTEEIPEKKQEPESKKVTLKKAPPLILIDGKVSNNARDIREAETVTELEEPLYIVNGIEYSEKEMFGPNPTSPYYPLNKQNIESIVVYEGKEAIEKFGLKGSKGVVVVKTKDGKPAVLKK
ncbi:hypothetical protein [Flavobacterium sp. GCM10023249]|uniref:hypothetical protein n=1 Tax=unclassified Flavobacterium TaxID=196869 RepID=UPI003622518D